MQRGKWLSEEGLQVTEKRKEAKGKGEKERYTHMNAECQRIARRDRKLSSVLSFLYGPTLISTHDYWKSHSFN